MCRSKLNNLSISPVNEASSVKSLDPDDPGTVGKNIIATTKIRNHYGAIKSFKFPILR